jgi:hypothetical protein
MFFNNIYNVLLWESSWRYIHVQKLWSTYRYLSIFVHSWWDKKRIHWQIFVLPIFIIRSWHDSILHCSWPISVTAKAIEKITINLVRLFISVRYVETFVMLNALLISLCSNSLNELQSNVSVLLVIALSSVTSCLFCFGC